jgi:mono/diheme cytochrome c family protein
MRFVVFLICVTLAGLAAGCAGHRRPAVSSRDPGRTAFNAYCAGCHVSNGPGTNVEAPPLNGSMWVSGPEYRLVKIVTQGLRGAVDVNGKTYNQEMPAIANTMTDEQIASLLSFVRRQFSVGAQPVLPTDVGRVRATTRNHEGYWTVEDLLREP